MVIPPQVSACVYLQDPTLVMTVTVDVYKGPFLAEQGVDR